MKSTIIVCAHNRPLQDATRDRILEMTREGAAYVSFAGCSDVARARCLSLTHAMTSLRQLNADELGRSPKFDTILMVDDDMAFELDDAQQLINYTRQHSMPASAMYATMQGKLAASKMMTPVGEKQLWMVGLGLLAIPAWALENIERSADKFTEHNREYTEFTRSSCRKGQWFSEDYELCVRLGGVHLLPIGVGHLKTIPIYPDETTINAIRDGIDLPESLSAAELDAIEGTRRVGRNPDGTRS